MDQYKKQPGLWAVDVTITSTDQTTIALKSAKSANHQLYVQRVTLSVTTHANAKVALTLQSSNATPVVFFSRTDLTAAAGVPDVITADFGPEGYAIVKGEHLHGLWSTGGSGPTAKAHIEGYEKLVGPVVAASTN